MCAARRVAALATSAVITLGACGGGSSKPVVALDGSPRIADAEGVVRQASINGITLDGGRHYDVSKQLISFSTYNRQLVPLVRMIGDYVQVGLKGKTVVWIAKIGVVSVDTTGHATTQYQGELVKVKGPQLIFRDGTVLTLAKGLHAPADPLGATFVVIDADHHNVQGATFAPKTETTNNAGN
ncbi:MAG TPA: hypothetical protein VHC63_10890 [Acidimicrobiales bacterium]|nr:hypothetical protein [Acidimicrobiales bacterium]